MLELAGLLILVFLFFQPKWEVEKLEKGFSISIGFKEGILYRKLAEGYNSWKTSKQEASLQERVELPAEENPL